MKLAFLDAHRFDDGSVRGTALVTDDRTRPLEFRVTEPVAPDELQQLLYGAVLDEHLLGDLCAIPLLEALRERADYVLVRDQALLGLQSIRDEPVLWIGRDEAADEGAAGDGPGVVLGYHGDGDSEGMQAARQGLRAMAEHYDLLEPFDRSAVAAGHVHAHGLDS